MGRALATAWLTVLLLLSAVQAGAMFRLGQREYRSIVAREDVRRIAESSFRYFKGLRPPAGQAFWKALGRNAPLLDPWGAPYILVHEADGGFRCLSVGPDGARETQDDISFRIPYGFSLDTLQPAETITPTSPEQRVIPAN